MKTTALASWFGSNRMLAENVGRLLGNCSWVGVPFAGGMSELPHIRANVMLVSDAHRHVINLARVVRDRREELQRRLADLSFHPDELKRAQEQCRAKEEAEYHLATIDDRDILTATARLEWAEDYFVTSWMARADSGGTTGEFSGSMSIRWKSGGGDSAVRYRSAVESLTAWQAVMRKCTFVVSDAFEFLDQAVERDIAANGLYLDPPFPQAGRGYKFNCGADERAELIWHTRLRDSVERFQNARVVLRFYDVPLIRELYQEPAWKWNLLTGRKLTNGAAPEVLIVRNGKSA